MNILIIYDSYFSNTKKAAFLIYDNLCKNNVVEICHVKNRNVYNSLKLYDYIFIGSPTRYGRPSKAIESFLKKKLPKKCRYYLFDTRMDKNYFSKNIIQKLIVPKGYALDKMKRYLKRKGYLVANIFPFYVKDSDGPLIYSSNSLKHWTDSITCNNSIESIVLEDISLKHYNQLIDLDNSKSDYHQLINPEKVSKTNLEYKMNNIQLKKELSYGRVIQWKFRKLIINKVDNRILGYTYYFWKSLKNNWLEIGLVIFNKDDWGKGIGYSSLSQWITIIFSSNMNIIRVGLSAWSGNTRMINLAKKLNFVEEGRYRDAIQENGELYDLVIFGLLRNEWLEKVNP